MAHRRRFRLFLRPYNSCWLPQPRPLFYLAILTVLSFWLIVPYDNTIRLATRWSLHNLQSIFVPLQRTEPWVFANPPAYPVNLTTDTLVIVKTGYGTRHRVKSWFEALTFGNNNTASNPIPSFHDFLLIADFASNWTTHIRFQDQTLPIHDVVGPTVSNRHVRLSVHPSHPRIKKYRQLQTAILNDDHELASKLSKSSGWELDALKFISGLELAYQNFPDKKWYILADDDTYLVRSSLLPLLSHLDSSEPHYLGNAVGDYKMRFAHGGSGVILSQAAMRSLLIKNPKKLARGQVESLDETWGDRLLARALMRVGVFLEERYARLFNGEGPRYSKIREDRVCSPVVGFHGLARAEDMLDTGRLMGNVSGVVLWGDLWGLLRRDGDSGVKEGGKENRRTWSWNGAGGNGGLSFTNGGEEGGSLLRPYGTKEDNEKTGRKHEVHKNWDHTGHRDESVVVIEGVDSAEGCAAKCKINSKWFSGGTGCLAWTWEGDGASAPVGKRKKKGDMGRRSGKCYLSPWMVFGEKKEGLSSGVNEVRLRELEKRCLGG